MSDADWDNNSEIERAIALLKSGRLVAFPTETVYGLGADATNPQAVRRIFAAKGRPATNPLIVHVFDAVIAQRYVTQWPTLAQKLVETFWPGPLTLVLPRSDAIAPEVSAGLSSVGLRSPDHALALDLLRRFDGPIAAPSANRANRISPTTAGHVGQELGDIVDLILDGGPCEVGIESTVLDLCGAAPAILRPGAITREQIEQVIGQIDAASDVNASIGEGAARSPGMGTVHYAPRAPAIRFELDQLPLVRTMLKEKSDDRINVLVVKNSTSAASIKEFASQTLRIVEMPSDPVEYAQRLYASLRDADGLNVKVILVEMPPHNGKWTAVQDRLRRASQPL